MSDPAKNYAKAMALLAKAEAAHREALEAIDVAREAGRSSALPKLRNLAQETERHWAECLTDADRAHRGYWLARKIKLIPELHRLALVAREFDVLAKASGDIAVQPWKAVFDGEFVRSFNAEQLAQEVPLLGPDCNPLEDVRGFWRWGTPA